MSHGPDYICAIFGILEAGGYYLPLDPADTLDRLHEILDAASPNMILTDSENQDSAERLIQGRWIKLAASEDAADVRERDSVASQSDPSDRSAVLFTSGSSGRPKGVILSHRYILQFARASEKYSTTVPSDRQLLLVKPAYTGSIATIFGTLQSGANLHFFDLGLEGFHALWEYLHDADITVCQFLPSIFRMYAQSVPPEPSGLGQLRLVKFGGERLKATDISAMRDHFPQNCRCVNLYAATETGVACHFDIGPDFSPKGNDVPVGSAADGTQVSILDEQGAPVERGEVGEIVITGRYLAEGYWNDSALTRRHFCTDPCDPDLRTFHSGDLGREDSEGNIEHLGRMDFRMKLNGFRVDPAEIEAALGSLSGVKEAIVKHWEREPPVRTVAVLAAYLIPDGKVLPSSDTARRELRSKLPGHMIPTRFIPIEHIPLRPSGKPDRNALPDPAAASPEPSTR
jgi:amino acid adenylation domain-containing protein